MRTKLYKITILHPLTDVTISGRESEGGLVVTEIKLEFCPKDRLLHPQLLHIAKMISEFLDGKRKNLDSVPLDLSLCSQFECKVLKTARAVRWGETISYSGLASGAGYPGAVRAVASVMRKNVFPLVIPCHRVIRKNGQIGGFSGEMMGKPVDLKRRLLELEA